MDDGQMQKTVTEGNRESAFSERKLRLNNKSGSPRRTAVIALLVLITAAGVLWYLLFNNKDITNASYVFKGEGEYWAAEIYYEGRDVWETDSDGITTLSSSSSYDFYLEYKGDIDELKGMEEFKYTYDFWPDQSGSSGIISYESLTANPVFSRGYNTRMTADTVVTVNLEWLGINDNFEMIAE
ncbi:hypothetical protein MM300_18660 [Evansella sp. LMS18]|jgi:hypothetical protein|uniref:hypothetical protein n=1 Tax=Evansella sp. LMS18 TaxID=2924033 RepID=UPI0020D14554|nr:hypothetical protein [Evansella sp. LMS18]UTR09884.1 hypothetical protein MM300_18660 [Evansella sp. LMS18]